MTKLIELEEKLKNNNVGWCPGNKDSVQTVLSIGYGDYHFKLEPKDFLPFINI